MSMALERADRSAVDNGNGGMKESEKHVSESYFYFENVTTKQSQIKANYANLLFIPPCQDECEKYVKRVFNVEARDRRHAGASHAA